jgi:parallel beta-helix repeat protein
MRRFVALCALTLAAAVPAADAAVITVTTRMDLVNAADGLCSLREALTASDANAPSGAAAGECVAGDPYPLPDTIEFANAGRYPATAALGPLPTLFDGALLIDGWSAPGGGAGLVPAVALDGTALVVLGNGLQLNSSSNSVRGLSIGGFYNGVRLEGRSALANWIYGNHIGVNRGGNSATPNNVGVSIDGAAFANVVGTDGDGADDKAESNVISGNDESGVAITGVDTAANRIAGNRIGTNRGGTAAIANGYYGVTVGVLAGLSNVIGTDGDGSAGDAAERNVISGNGGGIRLFGSSIGTVIAGNRIGTTANGTAALPNVGSGIFEMETVSNTRIGTDGNGVSDSLEGNLVSGNGSLGMLLNGNGTQVAGNLIGTDRSGTLPIPNAIGGVHVTDGVLTVAGPMTIGGPSAVFRNVIAGHTSAGGNANGLHVNASNITVECNYLGTDVTGTLPLPNDVGVFVLSGSGNSLLRNGVAFNTTGLLITPETVAVEDNAVTGNADGLVFGGPGKLDATDNFWGDATGPTHPANPGGLGDTVSETGGGTVLFNPFLTSWTDTC